jgi:hypothetical protein
MDEALDEDGRVVFEMLAGRLSRGEQADEL